MWIILGDKQKMFNTNNILYFDRKYKKCSNAVDSDHKCTKECLSYDKLFVVYNRFDYDRLNSSGVHTVQVFCYRGKDCHNRMQIAMKKVKEIFDPKVINIGAWATKREESIVETTTISKD